MLRGHRELLDSIAEALLERETLDADDIKILERGDDLPPLKAVSEPEAALPPATPEVRRSDDAPPLEEAGGEPSPALA